MTWTNKLKVAWPTELRHVGNAYGFAVHNERSREAVQHHGIELDPNSDIVMHVGSPTFWFPVKDKVNLLYMSWECHDLPPSIVESIARADGVIVSSPFLKESVRRFLPKMPCEVARLGVVGKLFPYVKRQVPKTGSPFVYLYVGAANKRKGWEIIAKAWDIFGSMWSKVCEGLPYEPVVPTMYYKVTAVKKETQQREFLRNKETGKLMFPRTVWDNRKLKLEELVELYNVAHVFLLPSYGECPGLTALEASATGLPSFITPKHGLADSFPPGTAIPLEWDWTMQQYMEVAYGNDLTPVQPEDVKGLRMPQARAHNLAMHMLDAINDYPKYLKVGKRASDMIHKRMTWNDCGRDLANGIRKIMKRLAKK